MCWSEVLASSFLPRKRVENHWKIRLKMASDSDLRSSCDHIRITPFSTCAHMIFTPYSECHTQQAGIHWYEVDGSKSNMNTELFFFLIPLVQSLSFRQQNNLNVTNTDLTLWSQLLQAPSLGCVFITPTTVSVPLQASKKYCYVIVSWTVTCLEFWGPRWISHRFHHWAS